ncbi:MAG: molybdopterin-dependent oxidoreductase [Silicimonas sp.]|nr:molybdopterin-dependent oxidoreductase [Silicimonas sp.]
MTRFRTLIAAATLAIVPAVCAAGDALLTFTHAGQATEFDMEALVALGAQEVSTTTIWTEGVQTFTGVPLNVFLEEVGVTEGTLKATAINDYAVEVPVEDAVPGGPIIAYLSNGESMSLREKGPLWIIYPYDSDPKYQTEVIYSRSIWQLDRIEAIE